MAIRFALFRVNLMEAVYGRVARRGAHRTGVPASLLTAALRRERIGFLGGSPVTA